VHARVLITCGVDGDLGKTMTVMVCVLTTDDKGLKLWPAGVTPSGGTKGGLVGATAPLSC
jgi:hypothetical protein